MVLLCFLLNPVCLVLGNADSGHYVINIKVYELFPHGLDGLHF